MWFWLLACTGSTEPKTTEPTGADTGSDTDTLPTTDTGTPTTDTGTPTTDTDTGTPLQSPMVSFEATSTQPGSFSLGVIGDQDGDGVDDLLLEAGDLLWSIPGPPSLATVALADADAVLTDVGRLSEGATGDVDGDGRDDVWLIADAVELITELPAGPLSAADAATASLNLAQDLSGRVEVDAVLHAGDIDGDGAVDVLVSDTDAHRIHWFTAPLVGELSAADARASWAGTRSPVHDTSAARLAVLDDLTGDGLPEALVGAYYAEHAYLLSDPAPDGVALPEVAIASYALSTIDSEESHLGSWIGAGDIDGDGAAELGIGDEFEARTGEWYFTSDLSGEVQIDLAAHTRLWQGSLLAGSPCRDAEVADLNGDGVDDLAYACPHSYASSNVYIMYGPIAPGSYELDQSASRIISGGYYSTVGTQTMITDLDGDDDAELAISDADGAGYWSSGTARLLFTEAP